MPASLRWHKMQQNATQFGPWHFPSLPPKPAHLTPLDSATAPEWLLVLVIIGALLWHMLSWFLGWRKLHEVKLAIAYGKDFSTLIRVRVHTLPTRIVERIL